MNSTEPSSPLSTQELPTPSSENDDHNQSHEKYQSSNGQLEDSDPWAFLEQELEEFRKIVAELEQMKLQNRKPGIQNE